MRNGNRDILNAMIKALNGSYRTYEEWKPRCPRALWLCSYRSYRTYEEWKQVEIASQDKVILLFLPYLWGMETNYTYQKYISPVSFLPYLWGMETDMQYTHTCVVCKVLTVPMRNGNPIRAWALSHNRKRFLPYLWGMETVEFVTSTCWRWYVLTVPMRNGNKMKEKELLNMKKSSYRTYEEWKLFPLSAQSGWLS